MGSYKVKYNATMPPEPFMKMAAKEVLSLRSKVASLEAENAALADENNTLREKRLTYEVGEKLRIRVANLEGELKALRNGQQLNGLREKNKKLKEHTMAVAKRYVEALNKNVPPNFKYLLELAYFSGRADENPDFNKFYKEINEKEG